MANGENVKGVLAKLDQSALLRLMVYIGTALVFAGGLYATFSSDRASFISNDARHDAQIGATRDLTDANAFAIRDLINALKAEKDIQSMRNGIAYATEADHETRIRKLERR